MKSRAETERGGGGGGGGEEKDAEQPVPEQPCSEAKAAEEEEEDVTSDWEDEDEDDEDAVTLLLSHDPRVDESHYITTHRITLTELSDHDDDDRDGTGSTDWDVDEGSHIFSFVDYASFDGDGAAADGRRGGGGGGGGGGGLRGAQGAATVSSLLESDLSEAAKFTSSDESWSKQQQQLSGTGTGQIRLSITTSSRAINEQGDLQEPGTDPPRARRSGAVTHCLFRGAADGRAETRRDRAKCVIAAPRRVHFGGRWRGREATGLSSGASSAVSELDDADREVRSLTARAFRSLDALRFSTSSESSASERGLGLNGWSILDLRYGNVNLPPALLSAAEKGAYKGAAPTGNVLTLSGNPRRASSQQIELMGKFAQGHGGSGGGGGVIRLTETLNFRCNVSAGERRTAGSRSTDEVTHTWPSSQRRDSAAPPRSMEDPHKKAIFASSLIKNVISKKMQFEQERKMERGEISEPRHTPPPPDGDGNRRRGSRELHRRGSRFSESGSDYAIVSLDELGDIVDTSSCDRSEARGAADAPPRTNLEPPNDAAIETKKGASEASRSSLHRSQNSAFRCWRDGELQVPTGHKTAPTDDGGAATLSGGAADGGGGGGGRATKMSHLFVPNIQVLPSDGDPERPPGARCPSAEPASGGAAAAARQRSDTLYIGEPRSVATSKPPEIKINLRSVRDPRAETLGVSKLRAPSLAGGGAHVLARTDESKSQTLAAALRGEAAERVPHFTVRDIRDTKGKLQTPIHQVRDVRKLVKSSYHFVSLDHHGGGGGEVRGQPDPQGPAELRRPPAASRHPASVSPIVIKCQSVNTNNHGKVAGTVETPRGGDAPETPETEASPEGAAGCLPPKEGGPTAARRAEKASDAAEKKPESKTSNLAALEKLQAAVKTMEQLYVFHRNEWKRKEPPPTPLDSHVLPLLAAREHAAPEEAPPLPKSALTPPAGAPPTAREEGGASRAPGGPEERPAPKPGGRSTLSLSAGLKAPPTAAAAAAQVPFDAKSLAPKVQRVQRLPMSLKISPAPRVGGRDGAESADDHENYLTIPLQSHAAAAAPPSSADRSSAFTFSGQRAAAPPEPRGHAPRPPGAAMETRSPDVPPAAIYHSLPLGVAAAQPQMFCFSPAVTPGPPLEPFTPAQRRVLLDPATGGFYLLDPATGGYYRLDAPLHAPTRRLFDPETGQYVEVPVPPQPPATPLPLPVSPLALGPAPFAPTYMIYPGFLSPPAVLLPPHLADVESGEKAPAREAEGVYMESPFYMTTVKPPAPPGAPGGSNLPGAGRAPAGFAAMAQPLISITSQQGPRIIAPPSFDGTTMSFVVEHR